MSVCLFGCHSASNFFLHGSFSPDFLALLALFLSVISSFFTQNNGVGGAATATQVFSVWGNHEPRASDFEFFECSTNIPIGLSCLKTIETCGLLLLY